MPITEAIWQLFSMLLPASRGNWPWQPKRSLDDLFNFFFQVPIETKLQHRSNAEELPKVGVIFTQEITYNTYNIICTFISYVNKRFRNIDSYSKDLTGKFLSSAWVRNEIHIFKYLFLSCLFSDNLTWGVRFSTRKSHFLAYHIFRG